MRILFTLLAMYMLAVFLIPCADRYGVQIAEYHQDSHDHTNETDMCSPFCLCNCCGAVSAVAFQWNGISFSEIKAIELTKPNPPYISQFIPYYIGEIWQPPKINA
ncbi:DUF6660 family protein [Parapedobacter sp.]